MQSNRAINVVLAGPLALAVTLGLGGCDAASSVAAGSATAAAPAKPEKRTPFQITQPQPLQPDVDYDTYTQHFIALQKAGLAGDYTGFASHLAESDRAAAMTAIQSAFGGKAFDSFTAKTFNSATHHRRVVELRGTGARLYLFMELTKIPGGWEPTAAKIGRNRKDMVARL